MVYGNAHIILPIMLMNYVWWLTGVRFLIDFACMYLAIRDRPVRVFFTTLLMNWAVYVSSWLIIDCVFAYEFPRLDVLGLRFIWVSLENAIRPGMGRLSFTLLIIFLVIIAVNFAIEYGIVRFLFPDVDRKKLALFLLLSSTIAVGLSMRAAYVKESQTAAFIKGLEEGAIEIVKKEGAEVHFNEALIGYEAGQNVSKYMLSRHLLDALHAYELAQIEQKQAGEKQTKRRR